MYNLNLIIQISGRNTPNPEPLSKLIARPNHPFVPQIWLEKSREQKLDYDMKSFNANKAKTGENGAGKYL